MPAIWKYFFGLIIIVPCFGDFTTLLNNEMTKNFSSTIRLFDINNNKNSSIPHYGNEVLQELNWIYVSRNIMSNVEYLNDMRKCLNSDRTFKCSASVHKTHSKVFVGQYGRKKYLPDCYAPDCHYFIMSFSSNGHYLQFKLAQRECASQKNLSSINADTQGGSSFEIFARNNNSISACSTTDYFNDLYSVMCPIQTSMNEIVTTEIRLSILLIYEHFGGFAEVPKCDLSSVDNRAIILDDAIIHVPVSAWDESNKDFSLQHSSWYSATWHVGESRYNNMNFSFYDGIRIQSPPRCPNALHRLPNLHHTLLQSNLSYYWTIEKTSSQGNGTLTATTTIDNSSIYNIQHHFMEKPCISPERSHNKFILVGDSHMRGFFDYFIARSIYARNLSLYTAKHNVANVGSILYLASTFASTQASYLLGICNDTYSNPDHIKTTIIINTGHWDLNYASLRNLIHDQGYGQVLVNVLRGILQGDIPCKGLRQIVWLTATPYPICANSILQCQNKRGLRSNANLRALNEFYLQNILRIKPLDGIRLSVVDVFNIIYPRIFLREMEEVICNMHFICREARETLLVTPGAMAAVRAIDHSVCHSKVTFV